MKTERLQSGLIYGVVWMWFVFILFQYDNTKPYRIVIVFVGIRKFYMNMNIVNFSPLPITETESKMEIRGIFCMNVRGDIFS